MSMKKKTAVTAMLLAGVMVLSAAFSASAATGVTIQKNVVTPAGKSINLVTISPATNRKPMLITAGGLVASDTNAANFVSTANGKGTLVAMVNGAYFNAYYDAKKPLTFPGNLPLVDGNLYANGKMMSKGSTILLGYTSDGKWLVDKVEVASTFTVETEKGEKTHHFWQINRYNTDAGAVLLFTSELGAEVPMPANARGYVVKDGVVTHIVTGAFKPAAGEDVIVIGPTAQEGMDKWETGPFIGAKITFSSNFTPSRPEKAADWANVTLAVGAGPLLLRGGVNVASDMSINTGFAGDAKHTGVAQRTFIGVKADNTIVIGEGSCNYSDAADALKKQGCIDAMALDGGASSFIHAEGQTIQEAGRRLNNVIAIIDTAAAPTPTPKPTASPTPGVTAQLTASTVLVNGTEVKFDAYNIGGNNYFKLRDLAMAVNGTAKQFEIGWDGANNSITMTSGAAYTPVGGELSLAGQQNVSAVPAAAKLFLNGKAISLTAYNIGGNNYFKLRDVGAAIDFAVEWDAVQGAIDIDTDKSYTE